MLFHVVFILIYLALIGSSTVQSHTETGSITATSINSVAPMGHLEVSHRIVKRKWHKHDDDNEDDEEEEDDDNEKDDEDEDYEDEDDDEDDEDEDDEDEDDDDDDDDDDDEEEEEDDDDEEEEDDDDEDEDENDDHEGDDDEDCDHWRHAGNDDKWKPEKASGHWHAHDDGWWHAGKDKDDCYKKRPSYCECHTSTDWKTTTDLRTTTAWFTKTKCQCSKTTQPKPSKAITTAYAGATFTFTITKANSVVIPTTAYSSNTIQTPKLAIKSTTQAVMSPTNATGLATATEKTASATMNTEPQPTKSSTTVNPTITSSTYLPLSASSTSGALSSRLETSFAPSSTVILDSSEEFVEIESFQLEASKTQSPAVESRKSSSPADTTTGFQPSATSLSSSNKPKPSSSLIASSASTITATSSSINTSLTTASTPSATTTAISTIATALITSTIKTSSTNGSITLRNFASVRTDLSLVQSTDTTRNSASLDNNFVRASESTSSGSTTNTVPSTLTLSNTNSVSSNSADTMEATNPTVSNGSGISKSSLPASSTMTCSTCLSPTISSTVSSAKSSSSDSSIGVSVPTVSNSKDKVLSSVNSASSPTSSQKSGSQSESNAISTSAASSSPVSSEDESYDSDLLNQGTQPKASTHPETGLDDASSTISSGISSAATATLSDGDFSSSEESYNSDLLNEGTQPKVSTQTEANSQDEPSTANSEKASSSVASELPDETGESYDSSLLHEGTQPKVSTHTDTGLDPETGTSSSSFESSMLLSKDESWDSSLLFWATQPVFTIVYPSTYDSITITPNSEYSGAPTSVQVATPTSLEMDSYYSSLLDEANQPVFSTMPTPGSGYSSTTITPDTGSPYSSASSAVSAATSSSDNESWSSDPLSKASQPVFSFAPVTDSPGTSSSLFSDVSSSVSFNSDSNPSSKVVKNSLEASSTATLIDSVSSSDSSSDLSGEATQPVSSKSSNGDDYAVSTLTTSGTYDSSTVSSLDSSASSSQFGSSASHAVAIEGGSMLSERSDSTGGSSTFESYTTTASSLLSAIAESLDHTLDSDSSMTVSINTNRASEAVTHESSSSSFTRSTGFSAITISIDSSNEMTSSSSSTSVSPISSTTTTFSDVPSASSSTIGETSSCHEFATMTTTDIYGDMVFKATCIDSLSSALDASSLLQGSSGALTAMPSTLAAMSSASSSALNPMESSCDDYTVLLAKNAYGSLVSETVCVEFSSATSSGFGSTITPTETLDTTRERSSSLSSVSASALPTCDHPTLMVEKDFNGVLVSRTVCSGPSNTDSQEWGSSQSDLVISSVSISSSSFADIISSSESTKDCSHFTVVSGKDAYGSLVMTTACIESIASSSISVLSTATMDQSMGSSTAPHLVEVTPSCDRLTVSTTVNAEGSVVSKTICDESSQTSISSGSSIEPSSASSPTKYSSILSASKPTETVSNCERTTIVTTTEADGSSVLRTICAESSLQSEGNSSFAQSTLAPVSTVYSNALSASTSMEMLSSCDHITTITAADASGSLTFKTVCAEPSASTSFTNSAPSSSYSSTTSSGPSSLETDVSCKEATKMTITDGYGSSVLTTVCAASTSIAQSSIASNSIAHSTYATSSVDYSSTTFESLETMPSCELMTEITTADAKGSLMLKTVCGISTSVSESNVSTTGSVSSEDSLSTISASSSLETPFTCDQFTTVMGRDVNGAQISQVLCVEASSSSLLGSTSSHASESTSMPSSTPSWLSSAAASSTITNPVQSSSLSSTVKSVNSYLSCEHLTTVYSKNTQGVLIPETICAESSTNMGATSTLSSLSENSSTSTIAASESMHLALTTPLTDCDHFSTTLAKNTVGSLVPQTICVESRAPKPSSTLVPSYVGSSASSTVEATSVCDHYTTITNTNANGELTSQTSCIEYDSVSEIFLVSPSSEPGLMLSTSISSAISSSSICDRYSTIVATNTLGSMTSLVVCAEFSGSVSTSLISDTATSTMETSQSASTLPPDSISSTTSSSSSDSKTSSGSNFISGRVSTIWETTPTSESSSLGASHSIVSSGSGSSTTSIYSTTATGSSEGMCATEPLPTVSVSMGSGDDTSTASFESGDSLEVCNTVNTMDNTAATPTGESSNLSIQKTKSLDTTTSSDQALPSTSELVCAPLAISGSASINSESPAVKNVPTNSDASGTALSACPLLATAKTSTDSPSSIPPSTSAQVSQASPSVVCDVQQPASAGDNLQCVDNSSNAKPMSDTDTPKEEAVCDNGNAPGSSSTGSSSSTSNEGVCGAISGSPSSSGSSNGSGGASSSSSSSSSGDNSGSSSSSSSGGSGGSSSSSSSSSGGGSSSSSSSSNGGGSSSSSSSSGGSSSSSSSSSGGQGGSSSSSSSGGGSSSSSSSSFGRSFLAECINPNDCGDALPAKEPPAITNKNARRSSKSRHSSTSSSSTSSTSNDKSGIRSSTTSKSETTTVEESVIVARSNGTSTLTRIQTDSTSVENSFEEEGDILDNRKDKLAINESGSNKLVKRKRLLKRPALSMKNTKRLRFLRSNRRKYQL